MIFSLRSLFRHKPPAAPQKQLQALKDFSLAAPLALDPEQLSNAIELLAHYHWDAGKAALHVNNRMVKGFDDAMMEKGDDPFDDLGSGPVPGPSG